MTETRTTAGPLSILIVDDEANIRRILSISLHAKGHKVIAVSNFQDAVTEAARQSFDLAFVDIRLGPDDGLRFDSIASGINSLAQNCRYNGLLLRKQCGRGNASRSD